MKTLDEVIFEAPYSPTPWEADALHYLKQYKQIRQDLLDDKKRLEGIELMYIHALANLEDNPPLTWDELKQMEGKPVWVEYGCDFNQKRWVIIGSFHGRKNEFQYMDVSGGYPNTFWEKDMGADEFWQAYRKERE